VTFFRGVYIRVTSEFGLGGGAAPASEVSGPFGGPNTLCFPFPFVIVFLHHFYTVCWFNYLLAVEFKPTVVQSCKVAWLALWLVVTVTRKPLRQEISSFCGCAIEADCCPSMGRYTLVMRSNFDLNFKFL